MREERKLNKALRQDGIETQADILDELKCKYPQYTVRRKSGDTVKRKRIAVVSSLAAVAACAAIIVPCAVLLPERNTDVEGGYCSYNDSEYNIVGSDYTLREYSEMAGGKILYFDLYDTADECVTYNYVSKGDGAIIGFEEYMYLGDTDEIIYLVLTETNVYIKSSIFDVNQYANVNTVDGHTVKWKTDGHISLCMFEDGGYRYFIRIDEQDENRLFELAGELLSHSA